MFTEKVRAQALVTFSLWLVLHFRILLSMLTIGDLNITIALFFGSGPDYFIISFTLG